MSKLIEKFKCWLLPKVMRVDRFVFNLPTRSKNVQEIVLSRLLNVGIPNSIDFSFNEFKASVLGFLDSLKVSNGFKFKFSKSQNESNLYANVYACLILDMFDELKKLCSNDKLAWIEYFDSFQDEESGLWYDPLLANDLYNNSDWWGARHLACHIIGCYEALGAKPKFKINFVKELYDRKALEELFDGINWNGAFPHNDDVDNYLMNIGTMMQYNRDFFDDDKAFEAVKNFEEILISKLNPKTFFWGNWDFNNPKERSRAVQFAYHLIMILFYDEVELNSQNSILKIALETQNRFGGFGVDINSSACEDIDSIDILIHLSKKNNSIEKKTLKKAFAWVLANQNTDGGFVFKLNNPIQYGSQFLSAQRNESHLFATWFRILSIAKLVNYLGIPNDFRVKRMPGYWA